jgi:hypothetical protein
MAGLPVLFNSSGPTATPPATLQAALIALVAADRPGYTANLPGSLIDDISGTAVGALLTVDQARVDAINSVTPYGSNPYVLAQLSLQFGLPQGTAANGNAFVVFAGSAGYVIPPGFIVGDGTNQYVIQDGGTIGSGGYSESLYVVATSSATFAIPAGSIDVIVTSVPSPYTLTVTNALAGTPALAPETVESYRARLLAAYQVSISGTQTYLKTLLLAVPGVSSRLVSVIQSGIYWEVICGGGDPYQVAGAIYQGVSQIGLLKGSATTPRNITVSIYDAPDTYSIVYVDPPVQAVTVTATWNTTLIDYTAAAALNQLGSLAIQSYINGIVVGQPINLLVMQEQFQAAVSSVLLPVNLTTLTFAVTINTVPTSPTAGTSIIPGDPESSFAISAAGAVVVQG